MASRKFWLAFLPICLALGILLRTVHVRDMEYKEDEQYHYAQSQQIASGESWPWVGMPSGVYLANPGMSVWVFGGLARISGARSPTALARALQLFAVLGMSLAIPFAFLKVRDSAERELWLWGFALAMVNPFLVLYQRKLWPQGFLPFFVMLLYWGFWDRKRFHGALLWGLMGALIGQIHMSGFFLAGALFVRSLFIDRDRDRVNWRGWLIGSLAGAWPLIPWAKSVLSRPVGGRMTSGAAEAVQLKFWNFWASDPLGLHLGNPLGINRGNSHWSQISDFVRYPLIGGRATYAVGLAHAVILVLAVLLLARGALWLASNFWKPATWTGSQSETAFVQNSALLGCGGLLTLTGVAIRRYYLCVTYPLEFVWLARLARLFRRSTAILLAIWVAELAISAGFVHYVHVNEGAPQGDYGDAYWKTIRNPSATTPSTSGRASVPGH